MYEKMLEGSTVNGERTLIYYFKKQTSVSSFLSLVDDGAQIMQQLGISKGDRVGLCGPNSPLLIAFFYSSLKIGAVAVMLNPKSGVSELERNLKMTKCRTVICCDIAKSTFLRVSKDYLDQILTYNTSKGLPLFLKAALIFGKRKIAKRVKHRPHLQIAKSYEDALKCLNSQKKAGKILPLTGIDSDRNRDAVILFSGGTSGDPTAVVHTCGSLNDAALRCIETVDVIPAGSSMLSILPMFHIFGLVVSVHISMLAGISIVSVPFFKSRMLAKTIVKHHPEFIPIVPTLLSSILKTGILQKAENRGFLDFQNFTVGFCGGDKASVSDLQEFNRMVKNSGGKGIMSAGYGLTECCPVSLVEDVFACPDVVGRPFRGNNISIVDEQGNPLDKNQSGEILIESSSVCRQVILPSGSFNTKTTSDGKRVFKTGDIGFLDDNGSLHFISRKRRIIKVSGITFVADAIENVIKKLPFIVDCVVVPVPDDRRGSSAFAFVELSTGFTPSKKIDAAIRNICLENLEPHAIPSKIEYVKKGDITETLLGKKVLGDLEKFAILKKQEN